MFITIYAAGMPFNGATIPDGESLGGSESAAYFMALELAKIGHTVTVFTSHQQGGRWDDVQYEWIGQQTEAAPLGERFAFAMHAPQDVVIVQRHPKAFEVPPNSKLNIWWLHDLALHRNAPYCQDSLVETDLIFTVSEFHREQVSKVYGVDKKHIIATKNGVDYERIENAVKHAPERRKKHLVFASRPERGLAELVDKGGIMEMLPEYHLHVCGYDNTTQQMASFYRHLFSRCEALPNVTHHGPLGKDRLYELLASCQAYVYPTMFEDTSNIMALEAAACGTPFIGMDIAALPETCAGGFAKLVNPKDGAVDREEFKMTIAAICDDGKLNRQHWGQLHAAARRKKQPWDDVAEQWDAIFKTRLAAKCSNQYALMQHFEHNSDIIAMRKIWTDDQIETVLPDFKKNYRFLIEDDFEAHYQAYYEREKARGVKYGPESLDGNPRFECHAKILAKADPKTVLDYGCAHGHYTINLAKRMPQTQFTGIDLAKSNVDIANKWAISDQLWNTAFWHGSIDGVEDGYDTEAKYDLIIASEVLEHVTDPAAMVNKLIKWLNPGGTMVISVPYGPWEAQGYELNPGWRAHIHHLERQDLKDLFSHFDDYKCLALPHQGELGHYVLSFTKPEDGRKCGQINYERKLYQQAPRQTLSVCMIARDEANNIGRCLESIEKHADEIIVGVDQTTTDGTVDILRDHGATFFEIPKVVGDDGIGFAAARNLTIEKATSDWILWIDADETLENVELLHHYLRPNVFDGYLINQHHYAAEPAALLQTDIPCRVFQNDRGIQFFGVVHEHPSVAEDMNAGPGRTYNIPNIHIMHTGYATENKRRKRFLRNFPLLERDRKENPERLLGKFLYVRDLAHSIRYERERNRGGLTETAYAAAVKGIEVWNELLKNGEQHTRFIVDSLPYYSECVQVVSNGNAIPYQCNANGVGIKGLFADNKTIQTLVAKLTQSQVDIFGEKYF